MNAFCGYVRVPMLKLDYRRLKVVKKYFAKSVALQVDTTLFVNII